MRFSSDIDVELIGHWGTDLDICKAAWVSSGKEEVEASEKKQGGLIRSLMRQKHGSPFEEGFMSFRVEAPRAVRDEHVRHRIGSYSSTSLRYRMNDPVLYIPPRERPLKKVEGFKQMNPEFVPYDESTYARYVNRLTAIYEEVARGLEGMEGEGFTETEALRWLTQDGLYVAYKCRFNPRSLMAFLSLRTHNKEANHVSYPMWEIEQVALKMEQVFASLFPLTHEAFNSFGREAP